jgi:hypothetical protein
VYWVYMKRRISTQSTVEEEIEVSAIESVAK